MTKVFIKKNGRLIEKTAPHVARTKATPEILAEIKNQIEEHRKLVPNKRKRITVINLTKHRSCSFIDALQIINQVEEELATEKAQQELLLKEKRKMALISTDSISSTKSSANKPKKKRKTKKRWVSIVSGGGGPGTGKKR